MPYGFQPGRSQLRQHDISERQAHQGGEPETLAAQAEGVLQRAILTGELAPETKLTLPSLEQRFGFGSTPLREALSRLVARGFVTNVGNKGFRVGGVSTQGLLELIRARSAVEIGALRLSMAYHDPEWEDGLVLATHRLKRSIQQAGDVVQFGMEPFDEAHREFHQALIAGCRSEWLIEIHSDLFSQVYRYYRVLGAQKLEAPNALSLHQRLVDVALSRDADLACRELREHLLLPLRNTAGAEIDRFVAELSAIPL